MLFVDIRHFTTLTETRLPFDVVFLLNRYFAIIGKAVEQAGGRLDKFIGDGAMALFGLNTKPEEACRQALNAAAAIVAEIENSPQNSPTNWRCRCASRSAFPPGPAVVGTMGYGRVRSMTAISDTVNVASRLESAAKEFEAAIVISNRWRAFRVLTSPASKAVKSVYAAGPCPPKVYVIPREKAAEPLEGKD
ncbi:adenylate/guanylate cyclase domain-containing protein [Rhizobium beringeri]